LPPAYLLVLSEIISSTLKMEGICSSETSVATQQTARRHIPEDDTLLNSYIVACVFITAVIVLPSRFLATIRGFLPNRAVV
jgi:hypothetical protein